MTKNISFFKNQVDKEKKKVEEQFTTSFQQKNQKQIFKLPLGGMKLQTITERLNNWLDFDNKKIYSGKMTGTLYVGSQEFQKFSQDFSKEFMYHNPLHINTYNGVRQMEGEVIQMTGDLFGQQNAFGVTTNGGTDSIFQALYSYRELGRERGITKPNIVVSISVHAAFNKNAYYLGIEIITVPVDKNFQIDIKIVSKSINKNTICLVGSAPSFPYLIIDQIQKLGVIAQKWNIGLHVDACLGGFLIPFAKDNNLTIEPFDFTVPGVTSISCDTHKYGLAPKGSSVLLYKTIELRRLQYFSKFDWTGGIYSTPGPSGSRSGAPIAGAWFSMMYNGYNGYKENASKIFKAQQKLLQMIKEVPQLQVFGNPNILGVSFTSKKGTFNIYSISSFLSKQGWEINSLQNPPGANFIITLANYKNIEQLGKLIQISVAEDGDVAMYATSEKVPYPELMDDFIKIVFDCYYKTK